MVQNFEVVFDKFIVDKICMMLISSSQKDNNNDNNNNNIEINACKTFTIASGNK
jgi:hypothetical protein